MSKKGSFTKAQGTQVTGADIKHLLGDLDDETVVQILAMQPTFRDLEEAASWYASDGDSLDTRRSPSDVVAEIVEILAAADEEEPEPTRSKGTVGH